MAKKNNPVKTIITDEDLVGYTLDEMLTQTYGSKEKASRKAADERIKAIAQNLVRSNTLKEIREGRNKSQHDVAYHMDVDDSVVSKLEKNFEKAQLDTILRYARALKAKNVNIVFEFKTDKQILQFKM